VALDKMTVSDIATAINGVTDERARQVLGSVLAGAANLNEARSRLETWFNHSMERVTGVYKRYTQFWLYIWATVIVVWLNVDTIEITRRLLADAQFRGALAAGAASFMAQANGSNQTGTNGANGLGPAGAPAADGNAPASGQGLRQLSVAQLLQEAGKLNLPLGWGACTNSSSQSWIGAVLTRVPRLEQSAGLSTNSAASTLISGGLGAAAPCPATTQGWRLKALGLLLTIAAVSQGAPFWFDLLNRVTNLRATGRPPEVKQH
jgi:hypothetical protein